MFREHAREAGDQSAACRRGMPPSTSSATAAGASASSRRSLRAPARRRARSRPSAAPRTASASSTAVPRTTSSNCFVSSRQTATRRSGNRDASEPERRREALRRLERDRRPRPRRELLPDRRERGPAARQVPDEPIPLGRRARSRRAPSRPPTAPGSTVTGSPCLERGRDQARARVADRRHARRRRPARSARRDARRGSTSAVRARLVVLVVREEARLDPVPLRAAHACGACPRTARRRPRGARASTRRVTSSRLPMGVAQTASTQLSARRVERFAPDERGADEPGRRAERGADDANALLRAGRSPRAARPRAPARACSRPQPRSRRR